MGEDTVRQQVRQRYAAAALAVAATTDERASCCGSATASEIDERFGSGLYGNDIEGLPAEAVAASLGCGNPLAVADLAPGERVLDLGSGGGIDVRPSRYRPGRWRW